MSSGLRFAPCLLGVNGQPPSESPSLPCQTSSLKKTSSGNTGTTGTCTICTTAARSAMVLVPYLLGGRAFKRQPTPKVPNYRFLPCCESHEIATMARYNVSPPCLAPIWCWIVQPCRLMFAACPIPIPSPGSGLEAEPCPYLHTDSQC